MSDQVPEGSDPRLAPSIRILIEVKGGQVGVQMNAPPEACIGILADAMKAIARIGYEPAKKSLIMPVAGAVPPPNGTPPLRRL